jgi:hypothetical protein
VRRRRQALIVRKAEDDQCPVLDDGSLALVMADPGSDVGAGNGRAEGADQRRLRDPVRASTAARPRTASGAGPPGRRRHNASQPHQRRRSRRLDASLVSAGHGNTRLGLGRAPVRCRIRQVCICP